MSAVGEHNEKKIAGKSVLDQDASIFQKERKQLRFQDLHGKDRILFIWQYYKFPILAVVFILFFVYSLVVPALTNVRPEMTVLLVNQSNAQASEDYIIDGFAQYMDYDKRDYVTVSPNFCQGADTDYSTTMAIVTRMTAGDFDTCISDRENSLYFSQNQSIFGDLSTFLPSDLMDQLSDYTVTMKDGSGQEKIYGLDISQTEFYKNSNYDIIQPTLSIIANTGHAQQAEDFVRYVFGIEK